jgi:hypothetical protein
MRKIWGCLSWEDGLDLVTGSARGLGYVMGKGLAEAGSWIVFGNIG